MVEMPTDIPCPVCEWNFLKYRSIELDIPYFGKATQTSIQCEKCGYKHNDILLNQLNEPTRYSMMIEGEEDLSVKVVRSASATVSIPELGLLVEPGIASEGYISNIEGVVNRFKGAVEQAIRFSQVGDEDDSPEGKKERKDALKNGENILKMIDQVIEGKLVIKMVIEDPFGNSAIVSEKALKEEINEEDAKELKTGFNVFEIANKE